MGHDITAIGNHKLNTSHVLTLAEDLLSRLDINITCGYVGDKEYFKLLGQDHDNEFVVLENFVKDKNFETFYLFDEHYQLKELHHKFGDDLFSMREFWYYYGDQWPQKNTIESIQKELIHPNYELKKQTDIGYPYMAIFKEHYNNSIPYYARWWDLCRFFTEKNYEDEGHLENFLNYRKDLQYYTHQFGGDTHYYLDDQSNVLEGVGQGEEWEMSWDDFKTFVHEKTAHLMLNIPLFLNDEKYKTSFHELNKFPLSFFDDFSDLK